MRPDGEPALRPSPPSPTHRCPPPTARSSYPASRQRKDAEGLLQGVPGSVELLNARIIGTQPIVAFDWSPDKEGLAAMACLDQTLRVFIVTKLHKY